MPKISLKFAYFQSQFSNVKKRSIEKCFSKNVRIVKNRKMIVDLAREKQCFVLIQGTIGRQGNTRIFDDLEEKLAEREKEFVRILFSVFLPPFALFFPANSGAPQNWLREPGSRVL